MVFAPCASGGTFLSNLGSKSFTFDLGVSLSNAECMFTLSWNDANGHAQSITLNNGESQGVSSSLPVGGVVSWMTAGPAGTIQGVAWRLERPHTALVTAPLKLAAAASATLGSVGGSKNGPQGCGSDGTLYTNLTSSPVNFDLSVSNLNMQPSNACTVTLSWTDANGHKQTITVPLGVSQAGSFTSLPAGGAISFTSSPFGGPEVAFQWELERSHEVVLVPPF